MRKSVVGVMSAGADLSAFASVSVALRKLGAVWSLSKPGISVFIGLTAATGTLLAFGAPGAATLWLFAAGFLCSGGAAAFNQWYERDLDARMARTARRALPSGELQPFVALLVAFTLVTAGTALAWVAVGALSSIALLFGALVYTVFYTVLTKRRTVWNVPIGGLCGSAAAVAGATAGGSLGAEGVAFAFLLYAWSAPHFWALAIPRARDYEQAGVPMLPVRSGPRRTALWIFAHALLLPLPAIAFQERPLAAASVALAGLTFIVFAGALLWHARQDEFGERTQKSAWRVFFFSLAHLPIAYLGFWLHAGF